MGIRMYCKEIDDKRGFFHDNESPKFYGYVSEERAGESWKFLKELYVLKKMDYSNLFLVGTEDFTLSPEEFKIFIAKFIQDLLVNGYDLRQSWLDTMEELKQSPKPKVIWWS